MARWSEAQVSTRHRLSPSLNIYDYASDDFSRDCLHFSDSGRASAAGQERGLGRRLRRRRLARPFSARAAQRHLLSKATTAAAIIFMITSLALTILISRPGGASVIREGAAGPGQQQQQRRRRPAAAASAGTARSRRRLRSGNAAPDEVDASHGRHRFSRSGGIGRHTILRGWRREACGFESRLRHIVNGSRINRF